jgi:hypothetical protein
VAVAQVLTCLEVREYVSDYAPNNYLIEGEEFSDTFIELCMSLAVEEFNGLSPLTYYQLSTFPSKAVLLQGTLWKMYDGKASLLARNTLSYADGGLQVPIEERADLYSNIAAKFGQQFKDSAIRLKTNLNMSAGWDCVRSDYGNFPLW